nr:hypothetical protein [Tanacetum cinerariifolium]
RSTEPGQCGDLRAGGDPDARRRLRDQRHRRPQGRRPRQAHRATPPGQRADQHPRSTGVLRRAAGGQL